MKLCSVTLTNFKSFRGSHTFRFDQYPGVYFVGGENQVEPRLGSNGAGKSSLWDSVFWCLYGRTPRNLRSGDVRSWGAKETVVKVQFMQDERSFVVQRTAGKALVLLTEVDAADGETPLQQAEVTQEDLQAQTRLNPTEFLHTVLLGQGLPLFFDQSPAQKMETLQDILELSVWEEKSRLAATTAASLQEQVVDLDKTYASQTAQLKQTEDIVRELTQKSREWDAEQAAARQALNKELLQVRKRLAALEKDRKSTQTYDQMILEAEDTQRRAKENYDVCAQEAVKADHGRMTALRGVRTAEQTVQDFEKIQSDSTCPTCLQAIDGQHLSRCQVEAASWLKTANTTFSKKRKISERCEKQRSQAKRQLDEAGEQVRTLQREQRQLVEAQRALETALMEVRTDEQAILRQEQQLNTQVNRYEEMGKTRRAEAKTLQMRCRSTQQMLEEKQTAQRATQYWIKGFKQIRLGLIDEALAQLTVEVNLALAQLGLVEWRVSFAVERETKSGGVSKGFTVFIHPPGQEAAVPWEAWSGGESQRLRLASRIGVSSLITGRKGIAINTEIFDEPTAGLSQEGIDDLLTVLRDRAETFQRQIFVVDHRTLDLTGFAGHMLIVKDAQGSRVQ